MSKHRYCRVIFLFACLWTISACNSNDVVFDSTKPHHGDGQFVSIQDGSFIDWLSMRWREDGFPDINLEEAKSIVSPVDRDLIGSPADTPRSTWIGHATVLMQYKGVNFLTDPHLSQHPFYFEFMVSERYTQPALSYEQMPNIDFVVISHNHYDHLDHRTVDMIGNTVTWFVPLGLKNWFLNRGIDADKVIELDWWEAYQFNEQVTVTFAPTQHWSKRTPWDTNESLWGSWSVDIAGFKSWFAGDTAYDQTMFKEIGERLGPFQFSMIPIGAYAPRYFMSASHIDPAQAIEMHRDIRSQQSLGIHWGTFQLTQEPMLEPPQLLNRLRDEQGLKQNEFVTMKIGESLVLDR